MLHGLFKSITFLQKFALYLLYINQKSCTFKIFTSLIKILARNNGDGGSVSVSKCCRCQLLECRERQVNVFFGARRALVFNRDGHTKNYLFIRLLAIFDEPFALVSDFDALLTDWSVIGVARREVDSTYRRQHLTTSINCWPTSAVAFVIIVGEVSGQSQRERDA